MHARYLPITVARRDTMIVSIIDWSFKFGMRFLLACMHRALALRSIRMDVHRHGGSNDGM
jgi:hypothetical protein